MLVHQNRLHISWWLRNLAAVTDMSKLCATALFHYQSGFKMKPGLRPSPTFLSWPAEMGDIGWHLLMARTCMALFTRTHLSPILMSSCGMAKLRGTKWLKGPLVRGSLVRILSETKVSWQIWQWTRPTKVTGQTHCPLNHESGWTHVLKGLKAAKRSCCTKQTCEEPHPQFGSTAIRFSRFEEPEARHKLVGFYCQHMSTLDDTRCMICMWDKRSRLLTTVWWTMVYSMNFQYAASNWTKTTATPSISSTSTMGLPEVGSVSVLEDCLVETLVQQVLQE